MTQFLMIVAAALALVAGPPAAAEPAGGQDGQGAPSPRALLPWAGRLHLDGWRYLGFNDHAALFVTDGSNKVHPPYLRFWIRSERFVAGDGAGLRSDKRLIEVDCRNFRWTMLDSRAYAENDLKGAQLASAKTAPWRDVTDPEMVDALMFVCLGGR